MSILGVDLDDIYEGLKFDNKEKKISGNHGILRMFDCESQAYKA